jgi:hypothetical protein
MRRAAVRTGEPSIETRRERVSARLLGRLFQLGLRLNATLTRTPGVRALEQRVLTPLFVRLTRWIRGRPTLAAGPEALGREWERLLGDRRYARVTHVDETTAYGEIIGECPLRGSADLAACHRLMAFDRGLLDPLGAHFIVLVSQAEPGHETCQIAIRPHPHPVDDLIPAHRIARRQP